MSDKILVIDDALEVRELIKAMLEGHGYHVVAAASAKEGLSLAKADAPALIMIDFLMPDMDGFMLFKEMKKDKALKGVPVIILTARARMEDSFKAMGVESFLAKPIKADDLFREVQRLLKKTDQVVPSTPQGKRIDSDIELESSEGRGGQKKVLIFGFDKNVLKEMSEQLEKESCAVGTVIDERELLNKIEREEPDLILIQLTGRTMMPIDELIFNLREIARRKADQFGPVLYNPNIVLYQAEEDFHGLEENLADKESLLQRCYDSGQTKYIGLYSSITFLFKIKVFLN